MAEACKILGRARATVRDLIASKKLRSEKHEGVNYLLREDVARLALELGPSNRTPPTASSDSPTGELAARAFSMLLEGKSAIDIVVGLKLTPVAARELVVQFNELRGMTVTRASSAPTCASCGELAARFCGSCVRTPEPSSAPEPSRPPSA